MATIRKKGNVYEARIELGRDPATGKRIQRNKSGFKTKRAAIKYALQVENDVQRVHNAAAKDISVKDYLNMWLVVYVDNFISPTATSGYNRNINHMIKHVGQLQLKNLRATHIQKAYNELLKHGRLNPSKKDPSNVGLSNETVRRIHANFHAALNYAVKQRLIISNPADYVDIPEKVKYQANFLNSDELSDYIDALKGDKIYLPIAIAAMLGVRRGAAIGLEWKHIDFKKKTILIEQAWVYSEKDKKNIIKPPKSKNGIRILPLPQALSLLLKKEKLQQMENKLFWGQKYYQADYDFVCREPDGKPYKPQTFSGRFRHTLERHNLPHIRIIDLRHSLLTALMENGDISPKTISYIAGHHSVAFTFDTYGHVTDAMRKEAGDKIDAVINKHKTMSKK